MLRIQRHQGNRDEEVRSYESHPTIQVGGDILIEPSLGELQQELAWNGIV